MRSEKERAIDEAKKLMASMHYKAKEEKEDDEELSEIVEVLNESLNEMVRNRSKTVEINILKGGMQGKPSCEFDASKKGWSEILVPRKPIKTLFQNH